MQIENSQDVSDEGPVFEVSPVTLGYLMQPSGAAVQTPGACFPFPQVLNNFSDPVLGDPVAFALSAPVPGSDVSPMTLPVYDAIRNYILAGTVFGSDGYGFGSIISAVGVVLRYATDL